MIFSGLYEVYPHVYLCVKLWHIDRVGIFLESEVVVKGFLGPEQFIGNLEIFIFFTFISGTTYICVKSNCSLCKMSV